VGLGRWLLALGALIGALVFAAGAAAYGWPVRPFDKAHPIRGNFGDPRTVFQLGFLADPWNGPGKFSFHNGVDISAPADTPVYPVASGIAHPSGNAQVDVVAPLPDGTRRVFQYDHIKLNVTDGQPVVARKTILGFVQASAGHVHLDEIDGFEVTNPLRKGHLTPFVDRTRPRVGSIQLTWASSGTQIGPISVCGRISVSAEAFDLPPLRVPAPWTGLPLAPALVTWKVTRLDGRVLIGNRAAADFRTTVPPNSQFWTTYARGTYQNAPRFGLQQFGSMPGRFVYTLTPYLDTHSLPNGVAVITVVATDTRGNTGALTQRISILNRLDGARCPEPPPPVQTTTTATTTTTTTMTTTTELPPN
jgi:hypothetical protein